MALRYIFIFSLFLLCRCSSPADNSKVQQVVPSSKMDSTSKIAKEAVSLTSFEMKDDSVFTDGSIPVKWENAGFSDVKGFKLFLKQAQLWIMDNDKAQLAKVIRYPLKNITSPQQLIQSYDSIFTKPVKLSFATINFSQIFRNDQGAMTEAGRVWFIQSGDSFRIIAINN